ncbi:MAG: HXXEE domain-containing protein [Gemmatimonadota bacterium]|nr:HXXEE domain-containing protein [Gemmatimonadota bacterium]
MSRAATLWLVPLCVALHNGEEALEFPRYLPLVTKRAPSWAHDFVARLTTAQMWIALGLATLIPLAVTLWAIARPDSRPAIWMVVVLQLVLLINAISHVAIAAVVMRGYSPGLLTAVVVNVPFTAYTLRRAWHERWVSARAFGAAVPAALFVHGPLLAGIVLLAASFDDA